MKIFFTVTTKTIISDPESGRVKKSKEQILVEAVSVTDAEVKATEYYSMEPVDFEIVGAVLSQIRHVIQSENENV